MSTKEYWMYTTDRLGFLRWEATVTHGHTVLIFPAWTRWGAERRGAKAVSTLEEASK